MSLKKQILEDFKTAFKNKDEVAKRVLSMLKSEIGNAEIEAGEREEGLSDEGVVKVVKRMIKQRQDSAQQFRQGGNEEMAQAEEEEIEVLKKYLPEQLSEEKVEKIVREVIEETSGDNFGQVMGAVMKKVGDQADGQVVRQVVEKVLKGE